MSAAGVGRAHPAVEHRHLAEHRAGAEHGDHRLAAVGRLGRDRDPAREHDVEVGRRVALLEDDVAATQACQLGAVPELTEQFGRQCAEEIGLVEHLLTCRHLASSQLAGEAIRATSPGPSPVTNVTFPSARSAPALRVGADSQPHRSGRRSAVKGRADGEKSVRRVVEGRSGGLFVVVLGHRGRTLGRRAFSASRPRAWVGCSAASSATWRAGSLGAPGSGAGRGRTEGRDEVARPVHRGHAGRRSRAVLSAGAGAPARAAHPRSVSRRRSPRSPRGLSGGWATASSRTRASPCSSLWACRRGRCVRAQAFDASDGLLVDTSVLMDGQLLALAREEWSVVT